MHKLAKEVLSFIPWLMLTFFAAFLGSVASINASTFYASLHQPDWAPPAWLFGPVWTLLYLFMAISAYLIWRDRHSRSVQLPLFFFVTQLALNALWSWLFFAWHMGMWAFVDITLLWCLITVTIISFWRVNILAASLLIPYIIWVSFAAVLNFTVWQENALLLG